MNRNKLIIGLIILLGGFMATIRISNAGINKLKEHEALRLKPYKDVGGKWTIGWGHLIKLPSERYLLDLNGINEGQADELLRQDLGTAESSVNRLVTVPLTGNQYDSLVSFVYNIGVGAFADSTMLKLLNDEKYNAAAAQFPRWKYVNKIESAGLLKRRAKEQQVFLS